MSGNSIADLVLAHSANDASAAPIPVRVSEVKPWECSPEVRVVLENMGVYEDISTQMHIIRTSKSKRDIDLAKSRLDAIAKVMTITKNGSTVHEQQKPPDSDEGFSRVIVDISRPDNG